MKNILFSALFFSLGVSQAFALGTFDPTNLSALADSAVGSLVQTAAIGSSYKAMNSATPLGMLIGLDVGLDVTAISLPSDFQSALSTASGQSLDSVPSLLPLPRLSVHKGLPFGFDLGFEGVSYESKLKAVGGEVQWAFLRDSGISAALRESFSYSKIFFLSTHSYDTQVVVSKNLLLIDPYVGAGLLFWNGDVQGTGLPVSIDGHRSGSNPHFFAGIPVKLFLLRVAAEADYNTAGIHSYGFRIGFGF